MCAETETKAVTKQAMVKEAKEAMSLAWNFAKYLALAPLEGRKFNAEDIHGASEEIADLLEKAAKALWGTDDFAKIAELGYSYEFELLRKQFAGEIEG